MSEIKITVLTPTYNRGELLKVAFKSLLNQTCYAFEWIIVDDGSTDNTKAIVQTFETEKFPIRYLEKSNGGKHTALNVGVGYAKGYLTLILDSDDYLTPDCISFLAEHMEEIKDKKFAGISGQRCFKNQETFIGSQENDNSFIDALNTERRKYKLETDKAEAYKTSILLKYPFPEFKGEKFLRESAVWDKIALDGYKIRWYKKAIYYCEYLENGLTKSCNVNTYLNSFKGFTYCTKLSLQWNKFPHSNLIIGTYSEIAIKKGLKDKEIIDLLSIGKIKLTISRLLYFIYRKIYRK